MEEKIYCTHCGEIIEGDDYDTIYGEPICEDCVDRYTTVCDRCEEIVWDENIHSDESTCLCHRCFENYYTRCEECDGIVHNDETYEYDNCYYCYDCYQRIRKNASIHEYGYKPISWNNDSELDKIIALNNKINSGATLETLRKDFENAENSVSEKEKILDKAKSDLKTFYELKEKIEIVFENKKSEVFTKEQAEQTLKKYPHINSFCFTRTLRTNNYTDFMALYMLNTISISLLLCEM